MDIMTDTAATTRQSSHRAVLAASIGNTLEWYDFTVYAFFAIYIGQTFFKNDNPTVQLLASFLAFGLGFVARPLGALILGPYADRAGRKAALTLVIMLMAAGTLLIAAAPPYSAIGIGAPILLVCGRVLQGFSAGGEVGGAATFLVEYAPARQRGIYGAWLQASMGISNILGALVGTLVTMLLTKNEIAAWGWRIPFIVGLAIAPVGLWIRSTLAETPHFIAVRQNRAERPASPLFQVFRDAPGALLAGTALSILWAVGPYSLIIFMPTYVQKSLGYSGSQAFTATLIGNLFLVGGCLLAGTLSDRFGRRLLLRTGILLLFVAVYPALYALKVFPATTTLILVQSLFCALVAVFVGVAPSALAEIFPTHVRSSGTSISYNTAVTLFGGFAPAILTWIGYSTGLQFAPALYVMAACVIALLATVYLPKPQFTALADVAAARPLGALVE
jgi:MHS family proline/betaine transporter-like MFS transporter